MNRGPHPRGLKVRPHVSAALTASLADEPRFNIGQPHVVRSLLQPTTSASIGCSKAPGGFSSHKAAPAPIAPKAQPAKAVDTPAAARPMINNSAGLRPRVSTCQSLWRREMPDRKLDLTVGKLSPVLNDWRQAVLRRLTNNFSDSASCSLERQRKNLLISVSHPDCQFPRARVHTGTPTLTDGSQHPITGT